MKNKIIKILRYLGYICFLPIWWLEILLPRSKNIWIFGAWYGKKYSDNSKWLYEYVTEHNKEIKAIWITKDKEIYKKNSSPNKYIYMTNSFRGIYYCLRAKYVFLTNTQNDINKYCINGARQIWLWHGMPLKKIGYSDDKTLIQNKIYTFLHTFFNPYEALKPYSTITSASFFTPFLKEAFNLPSERIWNTGLPRCDAFYTDKKEHFIDNLRTEFPNGKILLYMPTFRMGSDMQGKIFSAFVSQFGFNEKEFTDFLEKENIVFLFKPHFVDSGIQIQLESSRFKYISDNDYDDLYVLLNCVDGLITDYSSVYFDFLASKKDIYLFPFDYDDYIKNSRSHYFNMYEEMHGIVCRSWYDFYDKISKYKLCKNELEKDYIKFAQFLNGKSCEDLVKILRSI